MFIVAEIGASHGGSLENALSLVDKAAEAGADAVKFQCFEAEQMAIPGYVIQSGPWMGRGLIDLYRDAQTPKEWFPHLYARAKEKSLVAFASPFHADDVEFLQSIGNPIYKIASFELVDLELISLVASTNRPVFISTGMADQNEIERAILAAGKCDLTLLYCVSAYPTPLNKVNLLTMQALAEYGKFGLSDHSLGSVVPVCATALGASVIEKHICLDRDCLDGGFAMLPGEFRSMVDSVRDASKILGAPRFGGDKTLRRSMYWARDIAKGETITRDMIDVKRPAMGRSPAFIADLIGTVSKGASINQPII